jgi:hypothetical protein
MRVVNFFFNYLVCMYVYGARLMRVGGFWSLAWLVERVGLVVCGELMLGVALRFGWACFETGS